MGLHRWALAGALLAALACAAPAVAATPNGVLATDASLGRVAASAGTVAWSAWDRAVSKYRLIVWRDGAVAPLDVAPQAQPFDVSAGSGPDGATWLVWSRCADALPGAVQISPRGCDVVRWNTAHPGERRVKVASRRERSEYAPSIDGARIVFADAPETRLPSRARVLVAPIAGGATRALDAIPPTTCRLSIEAECRRTTFARVWATAIHGPYAAVGASVSTASQQVGVCGLGVARLIDLGSGAGQTLSRTICGLSGSLFSSVAFDAGGQLWWARTCSDDDGACLHGSGGPFRLDPDDATLSRLTGVPSRMVSFALAGQTPVVAAQRTFDEECFADRSGSVYICGRVAANAQPAFTAAALKPARDPDDGSLPERTNTRMQVLRPPAHLACGADGGVLWAGSFTPPVKVDARHARFVSTPRITVVATTPGLPSRRGRVPATQYFWKYVRIDLGGRACGRTWTLHYRATKTTPAASFRVRLG